MHQVRSGNEQARKNNRQIAVWLLSVCALIFLMIIVGGVTRLTESGLSMVNWHPIHGVMPPLGEAQWLEEFAAYKAYPEYQKVNHGMSLDEFKAIFYWEYGHRILGRLIGLAFFVPFVFFLWRKKVAPPLRPKLWIMFALGGLQGLVGWWMVKSGLVDRPDVSHYRLTAHLGLAVFIFIYIFWVALGLMQPRAGRRRGFLTGAARVLMGLIFVQILLGGLVAGLNAGMIYNSWPLMEGALVPEGLFHMSPWYLNFFENHMTVQFDHRLGGYAVFVLAAWLWWRARHSAGRCAHLLLAAVVLQVVLGILTLLHAVPISLAALHQAGAIVVLSAGLYFLHRLEVNEPRELS